MMLPITRAICATALCLATISKPAIAAKGEVCLSNPVDTQNVRTFDNSTQLQCKSAGRLTVSELYDKGWRIVAIFEQVISIKPDGTSPKSSWTVLIEMI